jgi:hypothetical protein
VATTNAQQFNPSQANQETDAAYTTDVTRVNGAGVDAIGPSISANKTLYQVTTYITALGQMMANKGFTNADANLSVLTTVMSNIVMSSDLPTPLQLIGFSPVVVLNAAVFNGFELALAGNMQINLTGVRPGQLYVFMYVQDSVGGRTVAIESPGVGPFGQPDPTPGIASVQVFAADVTGFLHPVTPMVSSLTGIVSTPIGATLPSTGSFTTLSSTSATALGPTTVTGNVAVSGGVSASAIASAGPIAAVTITTSGLATLASVSSGLLTSTGAVNANAVSANSGAFTELTAQTVPQATDDTNVATTGWAKVGLSMSLGATGFIRLPTWLGGLILNWGMTGPGGGAFVTFPLAFSANLFGVHLTPIFNAATDTNTRFAQVNVGATLTGFEPIISNGAPTTMCYYLAIGN